MKVLFVCKGNWFRSQIAEATYNKLTNTQNADSCGTYTGAPDEPEGQQLSYLFRNEPEFLHFMKEQGLDISHNSTRKFLPEMLDQYDVVICMAQESYIPQILKDDKKVIFWNIDDGDFVTREVAEDRYSKIKKLVEDLIKGL